jgi:hypothetical protein
MLWGIGGEQGVGRDAAAGEGVEDTFVAEGVDEPGGVANK